jgi:hypothetical protein
MSIPATYTHWLESKGQVVDTLTKAQVETTNTGQMVINNHDLFVVAPEASRIDYNLLSFIGTEIVFMTYSFQYDQGVASRRQE